MPGRQFNAGDYRYGFNGKEKDDEVKGAGNSLDFGDRIYDPRLGRWLSVDGRFKDYVPFSPYNFALNNPIYFKDADGNLVVDKDGRPVTVSITKAKDGTATATFEFSKGTTEAAKAEFNSNGARVINTLIQTTTGREQVQKVIDSQDKIHTNIVTTDENPEPYYENGGLKLGNTGLKTISATDENGLPTGEKQDIIRVNIFEESINEAGRNARNSGLVQDPNSPGNEFESNKLTEDQKTAAVAAHEYEHATNPVDVKLIKERKSLPKNDPQHKSAYGKGTQVAKEFGDKNKKK
jgi:RHS repeat-associated protein